MRWFVIGVFVLLSACTQAQIDKFKAGSVNFRAVVAEVNADIAAIAPEVAADCADLRKWTMLLAPLTPTSGKAQQYFGAANGALAELCQTPPADIASTARKVLAAALAARQGYDVASR